MEKFARWTTPSITYRPSLTPIEEIEKIFLVLSQYGRNKVFKEKNDASIDDGMFLWKINQEESSLFSHKDPISAQVDYITSDNVRYTTLPVKFRVINSAVDEVI